MLTPEHIMLKIRLSSARVCSDAVSTCAAAFSLSVLQANVLIVARLILLCWTLIIDRVKKS